MELWCCLDGEQSVRGAAQEAPKKGGQRTCAVCRAKPAPVPCQGPTLRVTGRGKRNDGQEDLNAEQRHSLFRCFLWKVAPAWLVSPLVRVRSFAAAAQLLCS